MIHAQPQADGAWLAPAKLNLMLRVLGRRDDGYHLLQTVFQFLDRADRIYLQPRPDGDIQRVRGSNQIAPEADLTVRAARLLQTATGCSLGVEIAVDKILPMGGGLGGGSSDAATVLHGLNQCWNLGCSLDELAELGLRLGADVPVFVRAQAAWAEGVGEQLTAVELPEPWYLVLTPPQAVSTAAVFCHPDLTRDSQPITIADFAAGDRRNDCLTVVLAQYAEVKAAYSWLNQHTTAYLTGTGGCLFAVFESQAQAAAVAAQVPAQWSPFVAKGCNQSPLMQQVAP